MADVHQTGDSNRTYPRELLLNLDEYFMAFAVLSAKMSKDPNTQVGACIVKDNRIVGTGYNDMPNNCNGLPWSRDNPNKLENKHYYVCHAELNAIINTFCGYLKGSTMYVTLFPCNECAKLIIQAGIAKVVYLSDKYKDRSETQASRLMLEKAGVECSQLTSQTDEATLNLIPEWRENE